MKWKRLGWVWLGLSWAGSGGGAAALLPLPAWTGELSGQVQIGGTSGPVLTWTLTPRTQEQAYREVALRLNNAATEVGLVARFAAATGAGSWRIENARAALGPWLAALVFPRVAGLADAEAQGELTVSGEGTVNGAQWDGTLNLALQGGEVHLPSQQRKVEGVALRGALVGPPWRTEQAWVLTVAQAQFGEFTLKAGQMELTLDATGRVNVEKMQLQFAGGTVTVAPFVFAWEQPEMDLHLRLEGIDLREIVALLPPVLAEARGQLDGELRASWSAKAGLSLGRGHLTLSGQTGEERARIRLRPYAGLITGQLSPDSVAYAPLQRVELGQTPLAVHDLSIDFQPESDSEGRTGWARLQAEPIDPAIRAPVIIEVRVAGPLDQLIKLGLDERVHFGSGR